MRILLAHNSLYYPSFGGGDKSNRLLMEALAARGHDVRVVARLAQFGPAEHEKLIADLRARGIEPESTPEAARFRLNGVDVHTLSRSGQLRGYFSAQIGAFDPDVIVTSTDDPGQLLFDIARKAERARLVYLVRATIAVPFGPDSSARNQPKTEMLRHADAIVGVSEYVAGYVRQWSGMDAVHVPISLLEPVNMQPLGRFDNPYVMMVNPCAVKGIAVFLALAEHAPDLQFAAVPTWGTSSADLIALRRQANVRVIDPVEDLDDLFRQTRVALVPSLWAEARSRVVLEAMMHGVPVIASDVGGLHEAKLGVPYLLPVNPITEYHSTVDENMVPVATVPEQDVSEWLAVLRRLTSDRAHWEEISSQSIAAATQYAGTLSAEPFERLLEALRKRGRKQPADSPDPHRLSDDKRKLLALRLRNRAAAKTSLSPWFPNIEQAASELLRLFCFPYAGGGAMAYRSWQGAIPGCAVTPALLAGRETRASEPPFDNMYALIEALTSAIQPFLDSPFAFFGHSMGAGIAFELARSLRRRGAPLPKVLIVSAASAPQLRTPAPANIEPSDEEMIAQLGSLGALPDALLQNPVAVNRLLPLLRADLRLYRNYEYRTDTPLAIPIAAYSGADDPNVAPEKLDGWREQTTAAFTRREFPGGHFYLRSDPAAVIEALRLDLGLTQDTPIDGNR